MANSKRKCKQCGDYVLAETGIKVPAGFFCSHDHAIEFARSKARKDKVKRERKEHREAKERVKTYRQKLNDVQRIVNRYVNLRDKGKPCISCGVENISGARGRHASHYRSVGACSALRFNTLNINTSCARCNIHLSGNIAGYRSGLIKKIGENAVKKIESTPAQRRYSDEWMNRAKKIFKEKCKRIESRL